MIRFFLSFLFFIGVTVSAAPTFPELTGRVVDQADVLTADQEHSLAEISNAIEHNSTAQVVVVTLKSLEGYDIAEYGYQLGRYWKIVQKGKDNGLLIIVAPSERKVRIEVGYGLEGDITDAQAHDMIQSILIPHFKQNDVYGGIKSTMDEIKRILAKEYTGGNPQAKSDDSNRFYWIAITFVPLWIMVLRSNRKKKDTPKKLVSSLVMGEISGVLVWIMSHILLISGIVGVVVFFIAYFPGKNSDFGSIIDSIDGNSGSMSGDSFDIFSGGGGSFGGGGASGSW